MMDLAPTNTTELGRQPTERCRIESHHFPSGHVHLLIQNGVASTCFTESPSISRVMIRPTEIHPSAFTFGELRFEALRVGGTMIIVHNDADVLEEIYPNQHAYYLANDTYLKTPQTPSLHRLIATFHHQPSESICRQLLEQTSPSPCH